MSDFLPCAVHNSPDKYRDLIKKVTSLYPENQISESEAIDATNRLVNFVKIMTEISIQKTEAKQ
ncbi:MAG: hypothetical protein II208_02430 [Alphaproteobacteria bacterium]|nr:hypothetical protein [Alphaproteobacteria bacterium]